MNERREYIRKSFQMYLTNKNQLFWWEHELKEIAIPGASGVDYSKESVSSGGGNSVEAQFASYADKVAELGTKIEKVRKQIELVRRTIEHFKLEYKAKGKKLYQYICARWLRGMSYQRAAIECDISDRTSDFWMEEIFTLAEAIADEHNLF